MNEQHGNAFGTEEARFEEGGDGLGTALDDFDLEPQKASPPAEARAAKQSAGAPRRRQKRAQGPFARFLAWLGRLFG